jgi:hypothetical protein
LKLKASFIVDILKSQIENKGVPFYIEKKGDNEAGAIFIKYDLMNGLVEVYHRVYDVDRQKKKFLLLKTCDNYSIKKFLKKQREIDRDIWIIEIEYPNFNLKELFCKLGL